MKLFSSLLIGFLLSIGILNAQHLKKMEHPIGDTKKTGQPLLITIHTKVPVRRQLIMHTGRIITTLFREIAMAGSKEVQPQDVSS